jgi:hypothetical protein
LVRSRGDSGVKIGVLDWLQESEYAINVTHEVLRAAAADHSIIILNERDAHTVDAKGNIVAHRPCPDGFEYAEAEALVAHDGQPMFVLVAHAIDGRVATRFIVTT